MFHAGSLPIQRLGRSRWRGGRFGLWDFNVAEGCDCLWRLRAEY